METINVEKKIKYQFELERVNLKVKNNREVSQNEFIGMLIENWRTK